MEIGLRTECYAAYIGGDAWAFVGLLGHSLLAGDVLAAQTASLAHRCTSRFVRLLGLLAVGNRSQNRHPNFSVLKTETEKRKPKTDILARFGSIRFSVFSVNLPSLT
jgi:uncharacterized cupin superfamily protein